ncbi:MAG: type IIL restriction-modification enzyme MmeI [Bacteroidota bacterium]
MPTPIPDDAPPSSPEAANPEAVAAFVARWQAAQAAEIANAQSFVIELCGLLGVEPPRPATTDPAADAYVFERPVRFEDTADAASGRIDLYKRGCVVLETKQGVDAENEARGRRRSTGHGTRGTAAWDRTMAAAKRQAARYARNLDLVDAAGDPVEEPVPPLVIACDVGHCLDLYANFGHPQRYVPFPDSRTYRVTLDRLGEPAVQERLTPPRGPARRGPWQTAPTDRGRLPIKEAAPLPMEKSDECVCGRSRHRTEAS